MTVEEKYANLFKLLEKKDPEKYKDKCFLVKKSMCRNIKLFLELSERNKQLEEENKELRAKLNQA